MGKTTTERQILATAKEKTDIANRRSGLKRGKKASGAAALRFLTSSKREGAKNAKHRERIKMQLGIQQRGGSLSCKGG